MRGSEHVRKRGLAWKEVWEDLLDQPEAAFKKSPSFQSNGEATAVWLRQGELKAREMACSSYDEKTFKETLHQTRALTDELLEVFMPKLQDMCAQAGVAVVFVPEVPKSRVSGAAMWKGQTPLIILSFRYKKNDHFWFTFFHEAGHIIKHSKKMTFLEFKGHEND